MEVGECERLQRVSVELTGNNVMLPVAAALVDVELDKTVSSPGVVRLLGGQLPPNRVAETLQRLTRLGVIKELPWPGKPHPRLFQRVEGPFWTFVRVWALDPETDCVSRSRP